MLLPTNGSRMNYHVLLKAYRGMVPEAFARFVEFFVAAGRDLNAPGPGNKSILKLVSEHRQGAEYAQILKDAGAQ